MQVPSNNTIIKMPTIATTASSRDSFWELFLLSKIAQAPMYYVYLPTLNPFTFEREGAPGFSLLYVLLLTKSDVTSPPLLFPFCLLQRVVLRLLVLACCAKPKTVPEPVMVIQEIVLQLVVPFQETTGK